MTDELTNLIIDNEKLIYSIIDKYTNYFDKDDLYQVAAMGLINAHKNYRENRYTKFSSYAYFYIAGEVKKFIRESNLIKVSKDLVKLNNTIEKTRDYLRNKFNREIDDKEIASFLELDLNSVNEAKNASVFMQSLDSDDESINNYYNSLGITPKEYNEEYIDLNIAIDNLPEPDKTIIRNRYMGGYTQSEISNMIGISQVQVSRIEKTAIRSLGDYLR